MSLCTNTWRVHTNSLETVLYFPSSNWYLEGKLKNDNMACHHKHIPEKINYAVEFLMADIEFSTICAVYFF
jgi:hypothetical protein